MQDWVPKDTIVRVKAMALICHTDALLVSNDRAEANVVEIFVASEGSVHVVHTNTVASRVR
jgi:hypothetical protein